MVSAAFPYRPFNLRDEVWTISQEINNNRTLVGWRLWVDKTAYSPTWSGGLAARWMKLDGGYVHEYYGNGFDFQNGSNFLLAEGQAWINHNADGGKQFWIEAAANFDVLGATSLSVLFTLPTIPRATQPNIAQGTNLQMGQNVTINLPRASGSFTHTVTIDAAGQFPYATVGTGLGTSVSYTIPMAILNLIPNSSTTTGRFYVATYNGGTYIGSAWVDFNLSAPSSVVPNFTTVTATEAVAGVAANIGGFVQNVSKLALAITGATSSGYGATIPSTGYKIEVAGQTISAVSGTTPLVIANSGTVAIKGTVTDSRGLSVEKTVNVTVLAYSPPVLTSVIAQRSTSGGVLDDDEGTYVRVDINASVQSLVVSTQRNQLRHKVSTRLRGTTTWTLKSNVLTGGITFNSNVVVGTVPTTESHEVLVEISDDFSTSAVILTVPVAAIFMHYDSNQGVGILKFREWGALDIGGDIYHRFGSVIEPIGLTIPFFGSTPPAGWLFADGSAVSRTTYAALFALMGTSYGAGNGTTTFNLPLFTDQILLARNLLIDPGTAATGGGGFTAQNAQVDFQDTTWSISGDGDSFNIYGPTSTDSWMDVGSPAGLRFPGLTDGKTYVFSATGNVKVAFTGSDLGLDSTDAGGVANKSRTRALFVHTRTTGLYDNWHSATQVPNTVNTPTRVSVEFTVPEGASEIFMRAYLGNTAGQIRWDGFRLSEKDTRPNADNTSYFDGDTANTSAYTHKWDTLKDQSPSSKYLNIPHLVKAL